MEFQDPLSILILVSSMTIIILVTMTISLFNYFQQKKAQYLFETKKREAIFEEELTKAQREMSEQTMQNIAWELHDNIGQLLSVVKMRLNMISHNANTDIQNQLSEINEVLGTCLFEVRQLSKTLNREYIQDLGLVESVKNELSRFDKLKFLKTHFEISGEEAPLPPKDELILFRILQEFFSNVIKHAKASRLAVEITFNSEQLEIIAEDDGIGFDAQKVRPGSGLINMKSRAELIQADLNIEARIDHGVRLVLHYALPKNEHV